MVFAAGAFATRLPGLRSAQSGERRLVDRSERDWPVYGGDPGGTKHSMVADIDLNQRLLWPWLGDWRSRIWLEGPARAEK